MFLIIIIIIILALIALILALIFVPIKVVLEYTNQNSIANMKVVLTLLVGGIKIQFFQKEVKNFLEVSFLRIVIYRRELKTDNKQTSSLNQIPINSQELSVVFQRISKFMLTMIRTSKLKYFSSKGGSGSLSVSAKIEVKQVFLIVPAFRLIMNKSFRSLLKSLRS